MVIKKRMKKIIFHRARNVECILLSKYKVKVQEMVYKKPKPGSSKSSCWPNVQKVVVRTPFYPKRLTSKYLKNMSKETEMENLGYIVLIRRSVYMSVLLCVHSQNDVFPSPFFLPYTKVAPSPSLLPLSSWFSNCTQNDVTAQHLSCEPRTKKK